MYCLLQYVLDSIQSKPNPSDATLETFSFKTNVSTEASFTIIKFLRKVLTFIMFNAENFYDESLSMTSMSSSFRYNRLMLARAKVERMPRRDQLRHKSAMKKARFSKVYQDMSVQGIPQAIEFGVVDLIVKLVRNGMSSQVWRKACKLGRELLDSFPADRIPLQERLFTVLSNPHNAPFFYGVKAVFSQAKLFIQRRAEKVDAKLEIDESYTGPIDDVCLLLSFLQKLCEGHFLPLQKLFLAQPQNIKQINILQLAMDLLHSVLKSFKLARMGLSMIEKVVTSILSFFTEVVQGPCKPNQNWLLQSTALGFCNKILRRLHDFFDQQTETYRISFKDPYCEKDFRVEDVFTNKPRTEGGLLLPDSVGDAVKVTLGGASKLGKKINESLTDLKRSAIRGNLARDFSSNAGKMVRKSFQLLMIDDEEDEESDQEQEGYADKWEAGEQVHVRYAQKFTNLRTGRAMYNWKKGTVVRRNPGNFFVFHYDHDREKRVQLSKSQLDSLLNNIEMKMVDLILGLLEGRADPMKFRSAFRKMKESLFLFFMKDIWVAASVDAYQDSPQEISITKSKAFRRTRMVRRATKFTSLLRTLATRSDKVTAKWLDKMTKDISRTPILKEKVDADLEMVYPSSSRTIPICSPDYLRVWMGMPNTQEEIDKKYPKYPVARVESIEILWHLPDQNKPALLPVTFPVPTGFMLLREETLNEVTNSLQPGSQKRKLQQLMEQFRFLHTEVKNLQALNRNVVTRLISNSSFMNFLGRASFVCSCIIIGFLLLSLVRADDTVVLPGNSRFEQTGISYGFDPFLLQQEFGRHKLLSRSAKYLYNHVFGQNVNDLWKGVFVALKVAQLVLIALQLAVYLIVHARSDLARENRDIWKCLVYRPFSYYTMYTICAVLAFYEMMISLTVLIFILEFRKRFDTAKDVFAAIVGTRGNRGGSKLLLSTLILLVLFCCIFSMLMFVWFPHDLPDENLVCTTYLSCAVYMLNAGIRNGGGIGESMWVYTYQSHPHRWASLNFVFNFAAFFIVNAILLNVVFGIIIDSFAERRDEKNGILQDMHQRCTICGIWTKSFVVPNSFRKHVKKEHNRWSYFKYILYLHEKDEDTYTGLEQYVWKLINSAKLSDQIRWFPLRRALSLKKEEEGEEDNFEDEEDEDGGDEDEEEEEEEGEEKDDEEDQGA